jgi:hypothetical protein
MYSKPLRNSGIFPIAVPIVCDTNFQSFLFALSSSWSMAALSSNGFEVFLDSLCASLLRRLVRSSGFVTAGTGVGVLAGGGRLNGRRASGIV